MKWQYKEENTFEKRKSEGIIKVFYTYLKISNFRLGFFRAPQTLLMLVNIFYNSGKNPCEIPRQSACNSWTASKSTNWWSWQEKISCACRLDNRPILLFDQVSQVNVSHLNPGVHTIITINIKTSILLYFYGNLIGKELCYDPKRHYSSLLIT